MDLDEPDLPRSPGALAACRAAARLAGPAVLVLALVVLAGWIGQVPLLRSGLPGQVEMKANTAVSLLFLGASLTVWTWRPAWRRAGLTCAALALMFPVLTGVQYLIDVNLRVDELLFRDVPDALATSHPGRMGLPAICMFQMLGWALIACHASGRMTRVAGALSLGTVVLATPSAVGYVVGARELYGVPMLSGIAPNTSGAFLACATGLLLSRPLESLVEPYTVSGAGGLTGRLLVPAILLVPLAGGIVRRLVLGVVPQDPDLAAAVSLMVIVGVFLAALHRCVLMLNRIELERRLVQAQLLQSQKMETVGLLAGGVAHDFNNLLTVIEGHTAEQLAAPGAPAELKSALGEVLTAARSAAALTRQLLAFSRRQVHQPRRIDPRGALEAQAALLRRLLGVNVELVLDLAPDTGQVYLDPSQLEQVVMNLALNARDAMPAGGRVVISARRVERGAGLPPELPPGPLVAIQVADTGHGIPDAIRARIFEPFFTTKPRGRGTGLGLSTVFGIVTQSQGAIRVDSREGHGTTFTIWFPEAAPAAPAPVAAPTAPAPAPAHGALTVMLVEDESAVRRIARAMLAKHGFTVLEAANGEEALRVYAAASGRIDMVITDVVMPGMSGVELARALHERGWTRPLVCMSGFTDIVLTDSGLPRERLHFLPKPFSAESLLGAVRDAMNGAPGD